MDDVDFRSGCQYDTLSQLVDTFDELDRHEFDDQMALEVHSMKEHIFHITGKLSQLDNRFPIANEYMLLSGGLKSGAVHIDQTTDTVVNNADEITSRGDDYDLDYTLLVPVLKVGKNDHPDSVILDMRKSTPSHSWIALRPEVDESLLAWSDCFTSGPIHSTPEPQSPSHVEQDGAESTDPGLNGTAVNIQTNHNNNSNTTDTSPDLIYLSPTLISTWFASCIKQISENNEMLKEFSASNGAPLGIPNIISCKPSPPGVTLILTCGGTRIQYDLIPVISFQGWPKVAEVWLSQTHCWQDESTTENAVKGFHLIPPFPISGDVANDRQVFEKYKNSSICPSREWRLCFARSEVTIKKVIPMSFMKSFYAFMAVMTRQLRRYRERINPYALRSIFFQATDRLPLAYLEREDKVAVNFLGLIDDILQCILTKSCPNYFINSYNIFHDLQDSDIKLICGVVLMVRSDAVDFLHDCVNKVRISRQVSRVSRNARLGKKTDVIGVDYTGNQQISNDRAVAPTPFARNSNQESSMIETLKRVTESNRGKSISVFLNPDDVTKPMFRVDDRFF